MTGFQPGVDAPRVLIVDDDQLNRGWLREMLNLIGFEVREAENGREAVLAWEQWRPHAILMDVRMPVIDGLEADPHDSDPSGRERYCNHRSYGKRLG